VKAVFLDFLILNYYVSEAGSSSVFRLKGSTETLVIGPLVELASDLDIFNIDEPGAINGGQQPSSAGGNS
jgi:hypothetical protein